MAFVSFFSSFPFSFKECRDWAEGSPGGMESKTKTDHAESLTPSGGGVISVSGPQCENEGGDLKLYLPMTLKPFIFLRWCFDGGWGG